MIPPVIKHTFKTSHLYDVQTDEQREFIVACSLMMIDLDNFYKELYTLDYISF